MIMAKTPVMSGQVWRLDYGEGNMNNKLIYVDYYHNDNAIICRYWRRGRWYWYLENIYFFTENKHLTLERVMK